MGSTACPYFFLRTRETDRIFLKGERKTTSPSSPRHPRLHPLLKPPPGDWIGEEDAAFILLLFGEGGREHEGREASPTAVRGEKEGWACPLGKANGGKF